MADTGFLEFNVFASDSSAGTDAWASPTNAQYSDDSRTIATASGFSLSSEYLKCTNLAGSSPFTGQVIIQGIEVQIEGYLVGNQGTDNISVYLVKGGTIQTGTAYSDDLWPSSDTVATLGGPTSLFGTTLTQSEVESSGFGIAIRAQALILPSGTESCEIDQVKVKIYYSTGLFLTL